VAYVNTEPQDEFDWRFFSNTLNLATVRRHKPRDIFDIIAEMNYDKSNMDAAAEPQNAACSPDSFNSPENVR
jgi:hypothetical protein